MPRRGRYADSQAEAPFKPQHQPRLGIEERLDPRPKFEAPDYRGSGKLDGRAALITGGDSGIGRAVAVLFAREGADIAIVYLPEEQEDALVTEGAVVAEGRRCLLVPGDVRDPEFACRPSMPPCGPSACWTFS